MKKVTMPLVLILSIAVLFVLSGCSEMAGEAFKKIGGCRPYEKSVCEGNNLVIVKIDTSCKSDRVVVKCPEICRNGACMSTSEWQVIVAAGQASAKMSSPAVPTRIVVAEDVVDEIDVVDDVDSVFVRPDVGGVGVDDGDSSGGSVVTRPDLIGDRSVDEELIEGEYVEELTQINRTGSNPVNETTSSGGSVVTRPDLIGDRSVDETEELVDNQTILYCDVGFACYIDSTALETDCNLIGGQLIELGVCTHAAGDGICLKCGPTEDNATQVVFACNDGVDNDNDGYVDLNDLGCLGESDDDESEPKCASGKFVWVKLFDNDFEAKVCIDGGLVLDYGCFDKSCMGYCVECVEPVVKPQCSDGVDNDGDGLVDYSLLRGGDPGCSSAEDDDETDTPVFVDVPELGPEGVLDTEEYVVVAPVVACNDGVDNDGDGFIDLDDPGCSSDSDDDEYNLIRDPQCSDGRDNDKDGLVDLADPGCSSAEDDDETDSPVFVAVPVSGTVGDLDVADTETDVPVAWVVSDYVTCDTALGYACVENFKSFTADCDGDVESLTDDQCSKMGYCTRCVESSWWSKLIGNSVLGYSILYVVDNTVY